MGDVQAKRQMLEECSFMRRTGWTSPEAIRDRTLRLAVETKICFELRV